MNRHITEVDRFENDSDVEEISFEPIVQPQNDQKIGAENQEIASISWQNCVKLFLKN